MERREKNIFDFMTPLLPLEAFICQFYVIFKRIFLMEMKIPTLLSGTISVILMQKADVFP